MTASQKPASMSATCNGRHPIMHQFSRILSILLCGFVYLVLCTSAVLAQAGTDVDFHISAEVEFYAVYKYPSYKLHKAIAIGPAGHWSSFYEVESADSAAKLALESCTKKLHSSSILSVRGKDCVLFDVDGKRTGKATPIGIPFDTVPEGQDVPWQSGKEWHSTGATNRGILLLLHGCDGFNLGSGWLMAWVNYYRAAGFRVILPNSFGEDREPAFCGYAGEAEIDQQTRILKRRVAQTRRTIGGIRKQYPGEKIYVHGYGEGGMIAQGVNEKIDGVVVTANFCGFGFSGVFQVAEDVPILFIAGTEDPYFPEASTAKGLAKFCRNVSGAGKMTILSVKGMADAATWWPQVDAAISKLLKMPTRKVGRPSSKGVSFPEIPAEQLELYAKAGRHKAIAANRQGAWSWYSDSKIRIDVEEDVLFACDETSGVDAYLDPALKHGCVLVDVNGKRLVK